VQVVGSESAFHALVLDAEIRDGGNARVPQGWVICSVLDDCSGGAGDGPGAVKNPHGDLKFRALEGTHHDDRFQGGGILLEMMVRTPFLAMEMVLCERFRGRNAAAGRLSNELSADPSAAQS